MSTSAIILAAGRGSRLAEMGWERPKCLLPFGRETLLDRMVKALIRRDISDIIVVVGYEQDQVQEAVERHDVRPVFIVNPEFAATNTIHSLWLARDHLQQDCLYFNADIIFDDRLVDLLLACPTSAMGVKVGPCAEEEVKVIVDDAGRITAIGKDLPPTEALGEFIGAARFTENACPHLLDALRHYNETLGRRDLFFESAVNDMLGKHAFMSVPIGELAAIEIDTPADFATAHSLWSDGCFPDVD